MIRLRFPNLFQTKEVLRLMRLYFFHRFALFILISSAIISFNAFVVAQTETEKDPVELFNQGQDAHEKGDFKTALKLYEEALKIAPEFPEAEYQKGSALQSLGRVAEAEKSYRQALTLRENWVLPMASLGEILVQIGKLNEAETVLAKTIELDANNHSAYLSLTTLRLKTKATPDILQNLLSKISNLPNPTAAIWVAKGTLEKSLGDKVSAQKSLNLALNLEPKNQYALAESIEILLAEKKYSDAQINAENLSKYYPNSVAAKLLLAKVYAENQKVDEALKIIDTLDALNIEVIALRNALLANSSTDIATLEKQLANDAKNPILLGRLCILTRTIPTKALEYCRRASEAEPTNITHAVGFGAALVQAKQYESAIGLLRKLLTFEPENYVVHANLATALFELKRYAEAKSEYNWLITNRPNLAIAYFFLAIAHDNLAEYTDARSNYQKFLQSADATINQLEIDKVNLRLPILEKKIKQGQGIKKGKKNE